MKATDIAIVGMSCRFPGGCNTPQAYWDLLASGGDAITEIPHDRWEHHRFKHPNKKATGRAYTFAAGTIGDIRGFDAAFFGISPREADSMDPHQRMLLELTWEALESGGQIPEQYEGRNCAVYVGISSTEYGASQQGDPDGANAYMMLGTTLSIAANRISYLYDLRGPSMAVDTACSSSLVALNEALHSIWDGRAEMAVAGGISLLVSPMPFVGFSKATMLSDYGQCRAFGANANGYVRGEGGGIVVLKPLAAAIRDGDPIQAVIAGAGANADGRTNGIALPSHETQSALIERTLTKFGIDPALIDFFEAHGTGTAVGDPAESKTISLAIASKRPKERGPLPIGSAKSNIGHLEPASGMAGLIKAVLAIQNRAVPKTLHAEELNPDIDFDGLNIQPVQALTPLEVEGRPIYAGLNSFGFGGANATVILREHIAKPAPRPRAMRKAPPLVLSAKSSAALAAMAGRYADLLEQSDDASFYDIAHTAAFRRARLPHRLIVEARNPAEIGQELRSYAAAEESRAVSGEAFSGTGKTGFIFNGNGAQWGGMGRHAYAQNKTFRKRIDEIDGLIAEHAGWSLVELLHAEDAGERLKQTELAQPALLAIQLALVSCLGELGLAPDAVAGHSVGEVAAAHVAGAIGLEQAVKLILARSEAQGKTRGHGRMAAAGLTPDRAREIAEASGGKIELAAINTSSSVTLAGDEQALLDLQDEMDEQKIFYRMLDLDYAFHSHVLDPVRDYFLSSIGTVATDAEQIPFYSTVRGSALEGGDLDASYWWDNVREPVRFQDAVCAMISDGFDVLVEIGPHAILQPYLRQILRENGIDGVPLATLTKTADGERAIKRARDAAFCAGAAVDLTRHFPRKGRCVSLPNYPWQHESHWHHGTVEAEGQIFRPTEGPLIGVRPQREHATWESQIDAELFPFLADHNVGGSVVFPAAGFAELALEASMALHGGEFHEIEMLEIRRPLVFTRGQVVNVRFVHDEDDKAFRIETRKRMSEDRWSLNAVGRLAPAIFDAEDAPAAQDTAGTNETVDRASHYKIAAGLGLDYGPAFQTVESVSVSENRATVALSIPDGGTAAGTFALHPALLDGCLQSLFSMLYVRGVRETNAYLPYQVRRLKLFRPGVAAVRCDTVLRAHTEKSIVADFALFDANGACVAEATGFRFLRADLRQGAGVGARRFRFELLPSDYAGADCNTPRASDIAKATGFRERGAAASGHRAPALDAIAAALDPRRPHAANGNGAAADEAIWREAFARHPAYLAELNMLMQQSLAAPDEKMNDGLRDHLLDSSPSFAPARALMKDALCAIAEAWPRNRRLRVLEVGTANSLIRELPQIGAKGTIDFTVVSDDEAQIESLSMEVESNDARFLHLDLAGLLPEAEQKKLGTFDVVVCPFPSASSGLTTLLRNNIRDALAPGGLLLLSEPEPARWAEHALHGYGERQQATEISDAAALRKIFEEDGFSSVETAKAGCSTVLIADAPLDREVRRAEAPALIDAAGTAWLVVFDPSSEDAECANAVCASLSAAGAIAIETHTSISGNGAAADALAIDPDSEEQWIETFDAVAATGVELSGVVLLGNISTDARPGWSTLLAARAMSRSGFDPMPRLHLVTMNASSFGSAGTMNLLQAPVWGIGRVIANEVPKARARMIDLRGDCAERIALAGALTTSLLDRNAEPEIVIGSDGSFVPRLRVAEHENGEDQGALKLGFTSGRLASLAWKPTALPTPGAREIVVSPRAAGLNFRDVMYALGVLPEEALEAGFAGASLGMEASGVVTAVGSGVTEFRPGDEVICFAADCFDSHILTHASAALRKPKEISFEEAATIPTAFFTVQYALDYLARLRKGERVLIHGAAGGVGLAALQVANHLGAEIYVTVGTIEKRRLMMQLGVPESRIFDSRSLRFADDVMRATNGEGVDVVLNSLAGEAIYRNLGILRPFGRFLELGKRDFYENNRMSLKFFRNNLTYFGIDADQLMVERPELGRELFAEILRRFEEGTYTPLPYRAFDASRISDAFRLMQKSGHTGKIVIRPPFVPAKGAKEKAPDFTVRRDASVFVSGGLSGFGLATARWFAAKGAGGLVLAGRSGPSSAEAQAAIAEFEAMGVKVLARACDVTDEAAVTALFDEAASAGLPVRGIVHAAAVFDDATLDALNSMQYQNVFEPKVRGALALHHASAGREIDFFVLYSSITTAFGNPGQANYVAANTFLEALAQHRRSQGLPAQAIGWGAIGDAGYLARNEAIRDQLTAKLGADPLSTERAMAFLEELLAGGQTNLYAGDINWQRLRSGLPVLQSRIYGEVTTKAGRDDNAEGEDALARMASMPPAEAADYVAGILAEEIGQVLRLAPEKIDRNKPVFDLGMDSLMALELKLSIEDRFQIDVPILALSDGATINLLAAQVVRQVRGGETAEDALIGDVQTIISRHVNDDDIEKIKHTAETGGISPGKTQFGT